VKIDPKGDVNYAGRKVWDWMTPGVDRQSHCTTLMFKWQTFFYREFWPEFGELWLVFD